MANENLIRQFDLYEESSDIDSERQRDVYWANVRVGKVVVDQISALGSVGDDGVGGHIDDGGVLRAVLARSDGTGTRGGGVGALKLSLRGLPVLESLVLPIAIASVVGSGVRDELLLGEGEEVTSEDLVSALKSNRVLRFI